MTVHMGRSNSFTAFRSAIACATLSGSDHAWVDRANLL